MSDYSKGKIYTIRCLNDPNVYVGSTIQSLALRMGGHRTAYNKNKMLGTYKDIVTNINDWTIELYELYPCNTKQELCRREGQIIRLLGTLNKCIAGRTKQEYSKKYHEEHKEENKDIKKEYDSIYRKKNKQKKAENDKEYQERNQDRIKEYQKEYRLKNKDKAKEYNKEYHLKKKSNLIIKEDE